MDLYSRADVSVNSRLHSGVLATSALRPTIYWATNIKYYDFMGSLGMHKWLVQGSRYVILAEHKALVCVK